MKFRPGKYPHEPNWRARRRCFGRALPAGLSDWLDDPGSLTRRLEQACAGPVRVQVLSQRWERPMHNEARRLRLRAGEHALIREVRLLCAEVPWVFARTVIPRATLCGSARRLRHLGSRPLGAVLFADPGMRREPMEVARLGVGDRLFLRAVEDLDPRPAAIWGRRSLFYLEERPLLVCEIFLPAIGSFPR